MKLFVELIIWLFFLSFSFIFVINIDTPYKISNYNIYILSFKIIFICYKHWDFLFNILLRIIFLHLRLLRFRFFYLLFFCWIFYRLLFFWLRFQLFLFFWLSLLCFFMWFRLRLDMFYFATFYILFYRILHSDLVQTKLNKHLTNHLITYFWIFYLLINFGNHCFINIFQRSHILWLWNVLRQIQQL